MDLSSYLADIHKRFSILRGRGILFLPELTNEDLLLLFFNSIELCKLVGSLQKGKIETCLRIIEDVTLKRVVLDAKTNDNLRKGLIASLLYFFDFRINPFTTIIKIYQEEIEKGNNITLIVEERKFLSNEWLVLLTILFCDRIYEVLNASEFKPDIEYKHQCWDYIKGKYVNLSVEELSMLYDIFEIYFNFVKINIKNEKDEEIIDKVIEKVIKLSLYNTKEFLRIISFSKHFRDKVENLKELIDNLKIILLQDNLNFYELDVLKRQDIANIKLLYFNSNKPINSINSKYCYFINNDEFKIVEFVYDNSIDTIKNEQIKLLCTETEGPQEEYHSCFLPIELENKMDSEIELDILPFICDKCKTIDFTNYCITCKIEKKFYFYCENCNERSLLRICPRCNTDCLKKLKFRFNYMTLLSQLKNIVTIPKDLRLDYYFAPIQFLEHPIKSLLRNKHKVLCNTNNLSEILLKALPYDRVISDINSYEIGHDEIILPLSLRNECIKIKDFLENETSLLYPDKTDLLRKLENIVVISAYNGVIHYPVKIKGYIDTDYCIVSTGLYEKMFNEYLVDNYVKIAYLNDILLNFYSVDYPIIIETYREPNAKIKIGHLLISELKETQTENPQAEKFLIKNISNAINETSMSVVCKRCGSTNKFIHINNKCSFCKAKINYTTKAEEIKRILGEIRKFSTNHNLLLNLQQELEMNLNKLYYERRENEKLDKYF